MSSSLSIVALIDLCDLDDVLLGAVPLGNPFFGTALVRRALSDAVSLGSSGAASAVSVLEFPAPAVLRRAISDIVLPAGLAATALLAGASSRGASVAGTPALGAKVVTVAAVARSIVCWKKLDALSLALCIRLPR